ncbi:MAG: hypothetical protein OXI84_08480 [bacterium]|nr:hypothetical protein [bacterium]
MRDTGEEIVVTRHGHPVARVTPFRRHRTGTLAGMATDLINLPADFAIDEVELLDPDWYEQWFAKWIGDWTRPPTTWNSRPRM